jgi:hypothetical protein
MLPWAVTSAFPWAVPQVLARGVTLWVTPCCDELPIRGLSVSQGLCDSSTPRWGTAVDVPTEIVGEGGSARWR